jgi:vacuolar-type H+-ATPase subunit H
MNQSLLETVADHEQGLLADLGGAEEESRAIVEAAQAEATRLLGEAHQELEAELAELRRKAADERAQESQVIEQAADEKVRTIHAKLAASRGAVIEEIVGRVLPAGYARTD